ncbi:hypothetical protein SAMN04490357_0619 [Streptomyces misionensis]|uniref:DUF6745 domain-containing protein n=1 Tax=Streptomyces misionensis TaxID=67331 RepID=A0A1H4MX52_9ACTN|nr:hypothetical protein SAMN04490357_0619 [Streptomyces misionensis]
METVSGKTMTTGNATVPTPVGTEPMGTRTAGTAPSGSEPLDAVREWREVAAATGAADRPAAEEGVRLAYRLAGLPEPETILWADSPRAGAALAARLTARGTSGRSVRDAVRDRPWATARGRLLDRLGPAGWAGHWALTGARLWDGMVMLTDRIRTGVTDESGGAQGAEQAVRLVLLDAVLGQHDAAWLAAFAGQEGADALDGIAAVARAAGWWWPYEKTAIVCERPVALHRDEAGRLDRGDGPALAFPDGFALYAWRGMPVPAAFLDELDGLTPRRIREEENAELRRVMLEHYGYDRYLKESGAKPVQRDETGVLWRVELPGDEPQVMVEVVNSTPEPDGTHRTYWLRVPPRTRTAREGVAWTFGLEEAEYAPQRQT